MWKPARQKQKPASQTSAPDYQLAVAEAYNCMICGARIVRQPVYVGPGFNVMQIGNHKENCPHYKPLADG